MVHTCMCLYTVAVAFALYLASDLYCSMVFTVLLHTFSALERCVKKRNTEYLVAHASACMHLDNTKFKCKMQIHSDNPIQEGGESRVAVEPKACIAPPEGNGKPLEKVAAQYVPS